MQSVYRYFIISITIFICVVFLFISCIKRDTNFTPKPRGYFRIELPEHQYVNLDTTLPFTFRYSRFASCSFTSKENFQYWIDLDYPSLHATLKMSYRQVKHDLRDLAMDEEKRLSFHIQQGKADDVIFDYVNDPQNQVYGRIYQLTGKDVATPLQFWVSDSITHFLRASLYFNFTPNNDSLQPVIDYLHEDILQIVNTLKWKE